LNSADGYEKEQFDGWLATHEKYRQGNNYEEVLYEDIAKRIGFSKAEATMRQVMLEDTLKRLPEVLASLNKDLEEKEAEYKRLKHQVDLNDPNKVKTIVNRMIYAVQERLQSYLDGNLEVTMKFRDKLQTLDDEIIEEEDSDWAYKELNHHSAKEDDWRQTIAEMEKYPDYIQPDNTFLGGKQYQRAIWFFRAVMIESIPDPYELQSLVPTATGYLGGGLQKENRENAMVKITQACLRDMSLPGVNYLVKHIGSVFRRLFQIALDDVRQGEKYSSEYQLVPESIDRFLRDSFDNLLWSLMVGCSNCAHLFLEPMYSTVDPTLPTFERKNHSEGERQLFEKGDDGQYRPVSDTNEVEESGGGVLSWVNSLRNMGGTAKEAKQQLRSNSEQRARRKLAFLPDERESMITKEETEIILHRSFDYMVGLVEFNLILLKFQLNHHLYMKFKEVIKSSLCMKSMIQIGTCLCKRTSLSGHVCNACRNRLRDFAVL
jgi:hypothetical protein